MWELKSPRGTIFTVIIVASAYVISNIFTSDPSPVISVANNGRLQGTVGTSRSGRKYYQFLGIPYAQPPVGKLRFESPQPAAPWEGILDATNDPPACKGFDFFIRGRPQGEESCLFLNVLTPATALDKETKPKTKLPVIVHIHGGGFHTGSAKEFPGTYFMDEDIVLVTVQYRLGIFGFLNTDDDVVRGNMGLKDQVLAMKWVQKNIGHFGGDPNQVTIMGHSAGGASVHLHLLSQMSTGLFHRAITFATDALNDLWQFNRSNVEHIGYVAEHFNCSLKSTKLFAECLRGLDSDELAYYHAGVLSPRMFHNPAGFGPSLEKFGGPDTFLTQDPFELIRDGRIVNKVPWMAGVNSNEGLLVIGKFLQSTEGTALLRNDAAWEEFLPHLLFYNQTLRPDAAKKIREYYFRNETYDLEDDDTIKALGTVVTEKMFYMPLSLSAQMQSKVSPVYLFLYTYEGFNSLFHYIRWANPTSIFNAELLLVLKSVRALVELFVLGTPKYNYGTCHGDEALLMYDVPINPRIVTDTYDLEMSKLLVKTVADFAHVSKPVEFNGMAWPAVQSDQPLKVMNFNVGQPEVLQDPFSPKLKFWTDLALPRV